MAESPTVAFILSLLGGIFVLIGGLVVVAVGILIESLGSLNLGNLGGLGGLSSLTGGLGNLTSVSRSTSGVGFPITALGGLGVLLGVATVAVAVLMHRSPERHQLWGSLVLVFSLLSWATSFGGLIVGFLLGLIGGVLAISWKPGTVTLTSPAQITRVCPACGTVIQQEAKFCPHCGKVLS